MQASRLATITHLLLIKQYSPFRIQHYSILMLYTTADNYKAELFAVSLYC
ncbi:hypothetical protein CLOSTMETH_00129 [[Clostridium] methylpentosum DSM 5476]|uniref:Uncharacterized protein n=1 Tax=[Clostridium] methylpentosum DSM 5476 TaxID=537013 RepID=C0E8I4_9FIRM|nr:hypothetical protein CLOSTMETH_00129 [[Clostridium] methylpentosum DSM 5476]